MPTTDRIPVTVLTGFLGSGKTTLLNRVLREEHGMRIAVIENEFGEIGIDDALVLDSDEEIFEMNNGCICCTVRGDLIRILEGLMKRKGRFDAVIIETTGLADPAPVIHTLMSDPFLAERYRIDGVVTAVDVTHAVDQLATHAEAVRQVAMADRLLLTKCDLADEAGRGVLAERLAALNSGARQIEVAQGVVAPDALFECGLYDAAGKHPDVAAWLGEEAARAARQRAVSTAPVWRKGGAQAAVVTHDDGPPRHDAGVRSFVLTFDQPLSWYEFSDGLGLLLQVYGARILRLKGLLNVVGDPLPRVLQCVQHSLYPTTSLPAWPGTPPYDDRRSRLVFIVRDLSEDEVVAILGSFTGQQPLRAN